MQTKGETKMCMSCTYKMLEQLRWELLVQEGQVKGQKVSPEVMESAKSCADENGCFLLPKMKLTRPKGMSDQDFSEAKGIFKDVIGMKREAQIAAISAVMDLLESEVLPQPGTIKISAAEVLQQDDGGRSQNG